MNRLSDDPTAGEVRAFLATVEPKADADRPARLNKQLTRHQAWEIFRDAIEARVRDANLRDTDLLYPAWKATAGSLIIRNINREFGSRRRR